VENISIIDILEAHLITFCALVSGIFFFLIIPKSMVFQGFKKRGTNINWSENGLYLWTLRFQ
jgi:hypothetical protein